MSIVDDAVTRESRRRTFTHSSIGCAAIHRDAGLRLTVPQAARLWGLEHDVVPRPSWTRWCDAAFLRGPHPDYRRGSTIRTQVPARVTLPTESSAYSSRAPTSVSETMRNSLPWCHDARAPLVDARQALFSSYELGAAYDEMFDAAGRPRPHCRAALRGAARASPQPSCGSASSRPTRRS